MDQPRFDTEGVFGEDYLYFYAETLTDARSDADTELIWRLLELEPGMRALDLACGHGRIANRLAQRGCRVTGLDVTAMFLDLARADAAERGVSVEYLAGDMRELAWVGRFDRVVSWFTSFGYFDDADNRRVLRGIARALAPGGRVLLELNNRDRIIREFQPHRVAQRDRDLMVDLSALDELTGRIATERVVVRAGRTRRSSFFVRLFTYTELRDWLLDAGFSQVQGYGEDGTRFTMTSRRMIVTAAR